MLRPSPDSPENSDHPKIPSANPSTGPENSEIAPESNSETEPIEPGTPETVTDSTESATVEPDRQKPKKKRSRRLIASLTVFIVFLISFAGACVAAWQIDQRNHRGEVSRATQISGIDISGETHTELRTSLIALQERLRGSSIDIGNNAQRFSTSAESIGLDLDIEATADAVMRESHSGSAIERFTRWVASHFRKNIATPVVLVDNAKLNSAIEEKDPGPRTPPTNPNIHFKDGKFSVVKGSDGRGLVSTEAPTAVRKAVKAGFPLLASVPTGVIRPLINEDDAASVIDDAERATSQPLIVSADGKTNKLEPDQLKPLMRATASGDRLQLDIDANDTLEALETSLKNAGTRPVEAGYEIQNNVPVVVDGKPGTACCGEGSATKVIDALRSRLVGGDPSTPVDLPMKTVQPKTTKADIPDLGIKEVIGSFTTHHAPNQPRVSNIHLIADLTRGTVIKPGATLSLNNAIGERTTAKGFVVDGVIVDGKFAESVGGGISQFATTLFNAAFFGGLDFGEYQSHTIYIERYPYGREATISYPHPDLQIKNTSPHGVLVWPTYTSTSITVTLYSTRYASGEQTNQTTEPVGKCTRVRTERTRTYTDGRTAIDHVSALYQPKEGERC